MIDPHATQFDAGLLDEDEDEEVELPNNSQLQQQQAVESEGGGGAADGQPQPQQVEDDDEESVGDDVVQGSQAEEAADFDDADGGFTADDYGDDGHSATGGGDESESWSQRHAALLHDSQIAGWGEDEEGANGDLVVPPAEEEEEAPPPPPPMPPPPMPPPAPAAASKKGQGEGRRGRNSLDALPSGREALEPSR